MKIVEMRKNVLNSSCWQGRLEVDEKSSKLFNSAEISAEYEKEKLFEND